MCIRICVYGNIFLYIYMRQLRLWQYLIYIPALELATLDISYVEVTLKTSVTARSPKLISDEYVI